ncbi:MAG: response regulator [Oscillospiraceae bacterium]|jgi:signal transduction histidine kinase/CheY-like chemotaxis protein/HPt (histidine-containing phosphotransfer) domain-containing protein|nr:response regulator [Oscillospiraceae bacterium]
MKNMSIKYRLIIPLLVIFIFGFLAQTILVADASSDATSELSLNLAREATNRHANELDGVGLGSYDLAVTLAAAVDSMSHEANGRAKAVDLMLHALGASYNIMGIWTCWEPNAFDGDDAANVNLMPYDDATGRFVPYVYRDFIGGKIKRAALTSYDDAVLGEYYQMAKSTKRLYVTEPFEYEIEGQKRMFCTVAVPILRDGVVVGAAGVDLTLDSLAQKMNAATTFESGSFFAVSPSGKLVIFPTQDFLMKQYSDTWLNVFAEDIENMLGGKTSAQSLGRNADTGEEFYFTGKKLNFANSPDAWVVGCLMSAKEVSLPSTMLAEMIALTGVTLTVVMVLVVLLTIRSSLNEVPVMTAVAEHLAVGDIDFEIKDIPDANTRNEIGKMKLAALTLVSAMRKQVSEVKRIGEGDYEFEITPVSDRDLLNIELQKMAHSLKDSVHTLVAARSEAEELREKAETMRERAEAMREKAEAASETKSNFLANMSHEMRTPLNAVIGLSELVLGGDALDEDVRSNIEKINTSGMTLLGLVNDILDLSKIEAGKLELIPVTYDIASLINDTVMLNSMRIGSKPIDFRLHISPELPANIIGDELRIKQVLNNLLSNAFKYTKEGAVDWYIDSRQDGDTEWLTFTIKDSGIGIKPEHLSKLFSDYSQVDMMSHRTVEGTGLGLSITKRLAEMMDGKISVKSEYGVGSTFAVTLSQKHVSDVQIGEQVAKNLMEFRYADSKRRRNTNLVRIKLPYARVLVVDDVPTNLDVARGILKPYGMTVDCVQSGKRAIELIRAGEPRYDAIFMDHMMPEMDGIEATRIIREEIDSEYAKNVPILALTANVIAGNDQMFLGHGFQAFLSKPIDIIAMDNAIRQWVRDKSREKDLQLEVQEPEDGEAPFTVKERHIEGLDYEKGLSMFGGDEESYIEVLKSYSKNTPSLIEKLAEVTGATLSDYATTIHGIKSSSRSIGAEEIGALAETLERESKAENLTFVLENTDAITRGIKHLLSALDAFLTEVTAANPKPHMAEPNAEVLRALAEACRGYDIDGVDNAMAQLDEYEYDNNAELVEWIHEQINIMGFKQIAERLAD